MTYIMATVSMVCIILFSFTVLAADIPSVEQGAQELDQLTCVGQTEQNCINDVCLNSEERNCSDTCRTMAEDKCKQQIDE